MSSPTSALFDSVLTGDLDSVKKALQTVGDVSPADSKGQSPLTIAAGAGRVDVAEFLLTNSPNTTIDHQDHAGWTPLLHATAGNHMDMVKVLLARGANVNYVNPKDGFHALFFAVNVKNLAMVDLLLGAGAEPNVLHARSKTTPLLMACSLGLEDIVARLLKIKGLVLDNRKRDGYTPLLAAVQRKHTKIVTMLLEAGADANLTLKGDGASPLMVAVQYQALECLRALLSKSKTALKLDYVDPASGATALHFAVALGELEAAKLLVKAGADVRFVNAKTGFSALMLAVQSGQMAMLEFITPLYGSDRVDEVNHVSGFTPLLFAAQENNIEAARYLIEWGADIEYMHPRAHFNALMLACEKGFVLVVRLLVQEGADVNRSMPDSGPTPLFFAVQEGHIGIVKTLIEKGASASVRTRNGLTMLGLAAYCDHPAIFDFLLRRASSLDSFTTTPDHPYLLAFAAKHNNPYIINILVLQGCELDVPNDLGKTALRIAAETRVKERSAERALLANGANPFVPVVLGRDVLSKRPLDQLITSLSSDPSDQKILSNLVEEIDRTSGDPHQRTALFIASLWGDVPWIELLLDNDFQRAKVNQEDAHGWTALHEAAYAGNAEACKVLVDYGAPKNARNFVGKSPLQLVSERSDNLAALADIVKEFEDLEPTYKRVTAGFDQCRNLFQSVIKSRSSLSDTLFFLLPRVLLFLATMLPFGALLPLFLAIGVFSSNLNFTEALVRVHTDVVTLRRFAPWLVTAGCTVLAVLGFTSDPSQDSSFLAVVVALLVVTGLFYATLVRKVWGESQYATRKHVQSSLLPIAALDDPWYFVKIGIQLLILAFEFVVQVAVVLLPHPDGTTAPWISGAATSFASVLPTLAFLRGSSVETEAAARSREAPLFNLMFAASILWFLAASYVGYAVFVLLSGERKARVIGPASTTKQPRQPILRILFPFVDHTFFDNMFVLDIMMPLMTGALFVPILYAIFSGMLVCQLGSGCAAGDPPLTPYLSIVAFYLYVPSSIYMSLFFLDKNTDAHTRDAIQFTGRFTVAERIIKCFMVAGILLIGAWIPGRRGLLIIVAVAMAANLALALLCLRMRPCFHVASINFLRTASFFLAAYAGAVTLFAILTDGLASVPAILPSALLLALPLLAALVLLVPRAAPTRIAGFVRRPDESANRAMQEKYLDLLRRHGVEMNDEIKRLYQQAQADNTARIAARLRAASQNLSQQDAQAVINGIPLSMADVGERLKNSPDLSSNLRPKSS